MNPIRSGDDELNLAEAFYKKHHAYDDVVAGSDARLPHDKHPASCVIREDCSWFIIKNVFYVCLRYGDIH